MYDVIITHIQGFKGNFSVEPVLDIYANFSLTSPLVANLCILSSTQQVINQFSELWTNEILFWNARIIREKRKSREEIDGSCTLLRGVRFLIYLFVWAAFALETGTDYRVLYHSVNF